MSDLSHTHYCPICSHPWECFTPDCGHYRSSQCVECFHVIARKEYSELRLDSQIEAK